jgi:hypothetical protein
VQSLRKIPCLTEDLRINLQTLVSMMPILLLSGLKLSLSRLVPLVRRSPIEIQDLGITIPKLLILK